MFDPFANMGSKKGGIGRSYISPGQVAMGGVESDATPMASYIPGGSFGGKSVGKGTVIPHHKPGRGGGSLGYNPHKPPHRNIIVDPHVPGRAVALDLSKIRPEDSEQAFNDGMEFAGEIMEDAPEVMDGIEMKIEEGPRLGAYAAVRMLAENYGATPDDAFTQLKAHGHGGQTFQASPGGNTFGGVQAQHNGSNGHFKPQPQVHTVPPASTGQAKAASFGVANVGQPNPQVNIVNGQQHGGVHVQQATGAPAGSHAIQNGTAPGPMAKFRPAPAPQAQQPKPQAAPRMVDQSQQAVGPPTVKVTFDFGEQVGQFPAQYHQAIRTPGGIVLAWDTRWPHGDPYSPEHLANQFAIQVQGDKEAHLVMAVANTFTFEFNGFRFYHLGIVESMPAE